MQKRVAAHLARRLFHVGEAQSLAVRAEEAAGELRGVDHHVAPEVRPDLRWKSFLEHLDLRRSVEAERADLESGRVGVRDDQEEAQEECDGHDRLDGPPSPRIRDVPVRALPASIALIVGPGAGRAGGAAVLPADLVAAEQRLAARFASRGLAYPPRRIALVALKSEAMSGDRSSARARSRHAGACWKASGSGSRGGIAHGESAMGATSCSSCAGENLAFCAAWGIPSGLASSAPHTGAPISTASASDGMVGRYPSNRPASCPCVGAIRCGRYHCLRRPPSAADRDRRARSRWPVGPRTEGQRFPEGEEFIASRSYRWRPPGSHRWR